MTRLVIDASTLLSAAVAAPDTPLARLTRAVRSGEVEMVVCERLLAEVEKGLTRRYFRERLSEDERTGILDWLATVGLRFANPVSPPPVVRDPDDDYLVELAKRSRSLFIVTGDRDLLDHEGLIPRAITAREAGTHLPSESRSTMSVRGRSAVSVAPPGVGRDVRVARHQRARLHGAMIECVYEQGYANTQIAQLLALAGVSRRGFYEQFATKRECFDVTFDIIIARSKVKTIKGWRTGRGWANRMCNAYQAFLDDASWNVKGTQLVMIETLQGSIAQDRLIRASNMYQRIFAAGLRAAPDGLVSAPLVPIAIVEGTRHLLFTRLLAGRVSELPSLTPELIDWVSAYRTTTIMMLKETVPTPRGAVSPAAFLASQDQRTRALAAVAYLAVEVGYPEITDRQIAKLAGLSTEALHRHFVSKEECLLVALDELTREVTAIGSAAAQRAGGWEDAVCLALAAVTDYLRTHPGLSRLAFVEVYRAGPFAVEWLAATLDRFARLLRGSAPDAQHAPRLAPELVVGALWAVLRGYVVRERLQLLPVVVEQLSFLTLAPYVGPKAAARAIQRHIA